MLRVVTFGHPRQTEQACTTAGLIALFLLIAVRRMSIRKHRLRMCEIKFSHAVASQKYLFLYQSALSEKRV